LVVSEIALAVVLLVSAGMLGRTLRHFSSLNPGVNITNLLVTRMALAPATLGHPVETRAAWQDVLDRARRVPGVQSVAAVDTVPMREGNNQIGYWTSAAMPAKTQMPLALATSVTPDYLDVMGIPLRRGRFFNDHDRLDSQPVVVIDEVMAQHAFSGQDPIGKRLWMPDMPCIAPKVQPAADTASASDAVETFLDCSDPYEVVGVVGHVRHWGLVADDQAHVRDQFYYPFAQVPDPFVRRWSELMSVAVRTAIPPLNVVEPLRREVRRNGDQVLYEIRAMEQLARATVARQRFLMVLFGIFAGLALLLACIGIYGVLAYLTGQRIPEIGLRMALGATTGEVMRLVLRQSLAMILFGVGAGTAATLATKRVLERSVEGMQPTSLSTFAVMIPVLVAAAMFAGFLPAHRASRVDPVSALRQE
jgi:putative ABC transport system permease protein